MVCSRETVPKYPNIELSYTKQNLSGLSDSLPLPLNCVYHLEKLIHEWRETYYTHAYVMDYRNETETVKKELYNDFVRRVLSALSSYPTIIHLCSVPLDVVEHEGHFSISRTTPPFLMLSTPLPDVPLLPRLLDCLRFSPAKLSRDSLRPLFVLFQVWRALREFHRRGFVHGDVSLEGVLMREDGAAFLGPPDFSRIVPQREELKAGAEEAVKEDDEHELPRTLRAWLLGRVSNFDYLMYLNRLAGRRMNDPLHHPILPWVIDFSRPDGEFRDLSKSMFRLNKGDHQLDLQFLPFEANDFRRGSEVSLTSTAATQVPHHVTDFISDITYYSYKARRIAKETLMRHVRPNWQPNEYPSSMSRMYNWTPDECIPEFFTDPEIFVSRHPDMKDLELPSWCPTPEAFLKYHRAVLESEHVSVNLHQWIDLTFGCKLSGEEAVLSKNVCLQLVDGHTDIRTSGVVQLFKCPHPRRLTPSRYFRPEHPLLCSATPSTRVFSLGDNESETTADEGEDVVTNIGSVSSEPQITEEVPRRSVRSVCVTQEDGGERSTFFRSHSVGDGRSRSVVDEFLRMILPTPMDDLQQVNLDAVIADGASDRGFEVTFPADYDPLALLRHYEQYYRFVRTTSKVDPEPFPEPTRPSTPDTVRAQHEDVLAFACLVVEVFAFPHMSPEQCRLGLEARIRVCRRVCYSHKELIPKPFHSLMEVLTEDEEGPPLTAVSAFSLACFPAYFDAVLSTQLHLRLALHEGSGVGAVDAVSSFLQRWGSRLSAEVLRELLLPTVVELLSRQITRLAAASRLFLPLAGLIGAEETNRRLLPPFLRAMTGQTRPLQPPESPTHSPPPPAPRWSPSSGRRQLSLLFNVAFVRQLLRCLGLRNFLNHLPAALVEALSGCWDAGKDEEEEESDASDAEVTAVALEEEDDEDIADVEMEFEEQAEDEEEVVDFAMPASDDGDDDVKIRRRTGDGVLDRPTSSGDSLVVGSAPSKMETTRCYDAIPDNEGSRELGNRIPRAHSLSVESCPSQRLPRGSTAEFACETVVWLAERLGPYLCSKFIVDNLLRMLVVCYADDDSLEPLPGDLCPLPVALSVTNRNCVGDERAAKVFFCLRRIAATYGEQMILLQFVPFVRNCIHSAVRGMTVKVQGGLLASVVLLQQTVLMLPDKEFTANLQEPLLKELVARAIRVTGSLNCSFPAGSLGRGLVLAKLLDLLYTFGMRLGFENTRVKMAAVLQQFFAPFSKVFSPECRSDAEGTEESRCASPALLSSSVEGSSSFVEIRRDTRTNEFTLGPPVRVASALPCHVLSESPRPEPLQGEEEKVARVREELAQAFTLEMAHLSYVTFCRLAGGLFLKENLYNGDLITDLYERYESLRAVSDDNVATTPLTSRAVTTSSLASAESQMLSEKPKRHLKGTWLSYWEHEKGRDEANKGWYIKQMKLQSYRGHTASIRGIQVLNSETSFFSYSKDKTVRLWSIRNEGEGDQVKDSSFVYRQHHKAVLFAGYVSTARLIASMDGVAHLWDPYTGSTVRTFSAPTAMQCGVVCPAPSSCVLTGEADGFVRLIDARMARFAAKWHTACPLGGPSTTSATSLRHLAVSPSGHSVVCAAGTGITWLDLRSGIVSLNNSSSGLRVGDSAEVLALRFLASHLLLISSSDLLLRLFALPETKHSVIYDQHREPTSCFESTPRREIVLGTPGGRLGVYATPDVGLVPSYTVEKLRSGLMRGAPSALALLSMNQLQLVGTDSGALVLLA